MLKIQNETLNDQIQVEMSKKYVHVMKIPDR
jgi:hypothetical protein